MRCCYVKHGARQSCRRNHLISVSYILLRVSVLLYTDRPTNRQVLTALRPFSVLARIFIFLSFFFFFFIRSFLSTISSFLSSPLSSPSPLLCHIVLRNYKHDNPSFFVSQNKRNRCRDYISYDDDFRIRYVTFEWRSLNRFVLCTPAYLSHAGS